jgi:hypothetical protein
VADLGPVQLMGGSNFDGRHHDHEDGELGAAWPNHSPFNDGIMTRSRVQRKP